MTDRAEGSLHRLGQLMDSHRCKVLAAAITITAFVVRTYFTDKLNAADTELSAAKTTVVKLETKVENLEHEARRAAIFEARAENSTDRLGSALDAERRTREQRDQMIQDRADANARATSLAVQLSEVTAKLKQTEREFMQERENNARRFMSAPSLESKELWDSGHPSGKAMQIAHRVDQALLTATAEALRTRNLGPRFAQEIVSLVAWADSQKLDCGDLEDKVYGPRKTTPENENELSRCQTRIMDLTKLIDAAGGDVLNANELEQYESDQDTNSSLAEVRNPAPSHVDKTNR